MTSACSLARGSNVAPLIVAALTCAAVLLAMTTAASAAACSVPKAAHVFYITDREPLNDDQLFSGKRGLTDDHAAIISQGIVTPGKTRGVAIKVPCATQVDFLDALSSDFDEKRGRAVLVYVHGYYTTFKQAAHNALSIAKAIDFPGPVVLYSWPAKVTSRLAYMNDESNANWSMVHFNAALAAIVTRFPGLPVSFAAHSMGSRFIASGIDFLHYTRCSNCFAHAVFFAPDIDGDTLRAGLETADLCKGPPPEAPKAAARVTLYVSNKDKALRQSQKIHGHQRAGQAGSEILLCGGVDTIDVSRLNIEDSYGHSYQAEPAINADVRLAIAGVSPAAPQRDLIKVDRAGRTYYELK